MANQHVYISFLTDHWCCNLFDSLKYCKFAEVEITCYLCCNEITALWGSMTENYTVDLCLPPLATHWTGTSDVCPRVSSPSSPTAPAVLSSLLTLVIIFSHTLSCCSRSHQYVCIPSSSDKPIITGWRTVRTVTNMLHQHGKVNSLQIYIVVIDLMSTVRTPVLKINSHSFIC